MESPGSYIELTALETPPRIRSATDGCLLFKSPSVVALAPTETAEIGIQTDPEPKHTIREKSLSIGLHVALIATFETLFFFQFVSGLADKGIISVVDRLSVTLFGGCQNLTLPARLELLGTLDLLANVTGIIESAEAAKADRAATNRRLLVASWLFTGGLYLLWLVAVAFLRRGVPWTTILLENAVMIGVLAVYEGIFVNVIVLNYDSVTLPEIEDLAFSNAYELCI